MARSGKDSYKTEKERKTAYPRKFHIVKALLLVILVHIRSQLRRQTSFLVVEVNNLKTRSLFVVPKA